MIERICPKCNVIMNSERCVNPKCGHITEMSSTIYWCMECNVPIYEKNCPICGKEAEYVATDVRPVFPEENMLISILVKDDPFYFQKDSVWYGSNSYIVNGKRIKFSVAKANKKSIEDVLRIKELYESNKERITYEFFDEYKERFITVFNSSSLNLEVNSLFHALSFLIFSGSRFFMTLSVYHKIEIGQREIYKNEVEPLAKSFALSANEMFDKIANLYKSGELTKQINKVKERVKSVLVPDSPVSGIDMHDGLYGAKLYDSARRKLVPVFGSPSGRHISFKKNDKIMIVAPASLEGRKSIYAVIPNSKRSGGFIPEKSYVFVDALQPAKAGDLALCLDADFAALGSDDVLDANIAVVHSDSKGKLYGAVVDPQEKIFAKTMHKVVLILTE